MVRHRQTAEAERSEHAGEGRKQNRDLEGDYDIGRTAMQRAPCDIDRIVVHRDEVLQHVSDEGAQQSAAKHDQRKLIFVQVQYVVQLFDGERRVGIQLAIAFLV